MSCQLHLAAMFKRIAHICLNVRNLQQSLDFYTRLGLVPVFRFTRKGARFGVYLNSPAPRFTRGCGASVLPEFSLNVAGSARERR